MYFGSDIGWFFSKGTWIFLGICVTLALWKVIDILIWFFSHLAWV